MKFREFIFFAVVASLTCTSLLIAQSSPNRVGTTAAGFLELGFEPKGIAMGDACVSVVKDLSAIYWNPAGLAFMQNNEVYFSYQPWIANTQSYLAAAGFVFPSLGTFAFSVLGMNYGTMEVTTVDLQEGTGENFSPADLAVNLSYGRSLTTWFGFGATIKYINSSIYHTTADAVALDLGVTIKTSFLSPTDDRNGMKIGMSLSNYGTRMRYDGLDLLRSVDISPEEAGNYKEVKVEYQTESWELPLIFRIGISVNPIATLRQQLTLAVNGLHANNNNETVNLGAIYSYNLPGVGKVFLRGGYRGIFLDNSEFGPTYGVGVLLQSLNHAGIQFDYAYRDIGVFGYSNVIGFSFLY